jgi:hypothetical protein
MRNTPNLLPGVPLIESPFFDDFLGDGRLNEQEFQIASDLRKNGYAIFDFPEEEFAEVSGRLKTSMEPHFEFDKWRNGEVYDLRSQDSWKTNADVRRIANNPKILQLLSKLYGRSAFPFQTLTFPVGTQQHFHSDSIHFSSMPERFMCGVWVALEDITLEQGPLIYYPGSHSWPIYSNEHIGYTHFGSPYTTQHVYEHMWEALVAANRVEPVRFTAKAGQALIWAANLLHGGDLQTDKSKTRWSQVTHYLFENCSYYTPMGTDYAFGSVQFREPYNIMTGEKIENRYNGRAVPREFIEFTSPSRARAQFDEVNLPPDFDPELYLKANPDVAALGYDPIAHYLRYGSKEEHRLNFDRNLPADFDPELYLSANPDVAAIGYDAAAHYMRYGSKEGRKLRPAEGQAGEVSLEP